MKKILISLGLVSMSLAYTVNLNAQEAVAQEAVKLESGPVLSVDKTVHDYGKIKKNADGTCYFTITNDGTEPLLITNAKGSCGCTVPNWPREAIAPGESAKMSVKYATNRVGPINKTVTITSNSVNAKTKVVRIKGEVLKPAPENGAPVNPSTSPMLKS